MISLTLPYPPTVNHYYGRTKFGGVYIKPKGKTYRREVSVLMANQKLKPISGPLKVVIEVFPPDKRKRDSDNLNKALLDALQHGGAYNDDSQIVDLRSIKRKPVKNGMVWVRINPANQSDGGMKGTKREML